MSTAVIEQVRQDTTRAVRNLPDAHGSWQFWRSAAFRRAIRDVIAAIYDLDTEGLSDEHLQLIETVIRVVINLIDIHVAALSTSTRDAEDRDEFQLMRARLKAALEGVAQGLAPDPAKRPNDEELMDRLSAGLRRARVV